MSFRLIFFLLVFVNLIFLIGTAGYLGESSEGREPQRLVQQLHPEQLRIVRNATEATQPPAPSSSPPPAAVTAPATPAASTKPAAPAAATLSATPSAAPLPRTPTDSAP